MVIIMSNALIKEDIYKTISKIAKRENTTEDDIINELLSKGIEDRIDEEYDVKLLKKN